jgi:hypothetical protein
VYFISETTRVAVLGRQPVVCVVKNAAAVGSDVGAAVAIGVGVGEELGVDARVADGATDGDDEGALATGPQTQAVRKSVPRSASARKMVTDPADGLRAGGRAGGASSDRLRLEA